MNMFDCRISIGQIGYVFRELYFNTEGEFIIRQHIRETNSEKELKGHQIAEAVQWFFDDVLKNVFSLS